MSAFRTVTVARCADIYASASHFTCDVCSRTIVAPRATRSSAQIAVPRPRPRLCADLKTQRESRSYQHAILRTLRRFHISFRVLVAWVVRQATRSHNQTRGFTRVLLSLCLVTPASHASGRCTPLSSRLFKICSVGIAFLNTICLSSHFVSFPLPIRTAD